MANQTQIPVIQSSDSSITQLQQNANKVLRNLNNQLVEIVTAIEETVIVGEVKYASLTLIQFQAVVGTDWVLCNGASCVGTTYEQLTGNHVVPTIAGPPNAFIRVN